MPPVPLHHKAQSKNDSNTIQDTMPRADDPPRLQFGQRESTSPGVLTMEHPSLGQSIKRKLAQQRLMSQAIRTLKPKLDALSGVVGVCVLDIYSMEVLASSDRRSGYNVELAGSVALELLAASQTCIDAQRELDDSLETVIITLGEQLHLYGQASSRPGLFLYMILERDEANLGMARHVLHQSCRTL